MRNLEEQPVLLAQWILECIGKLEWKVWKGICWQMNWADKLFKNTTGNKKVGKTIMSELPLNMAKNPLKD